jgi:hypothetical protein
MEQLQNTLVVSGMLLTVIAFLWSSTRESKYIRAQSKRIERKAILDIVTGYKPMSADPDVNDFRRYLINAIKDRTPNDDV